MEIRSIALFCGPDFDPQIAAGFTAHWQAAGADYIQSLPDFTMTEPTYTNYDYMGAVITESILQAGIK